MLTELQRKQLLQIARDSIVAVLDGHRPVLDPSRFDDELRRPAGAFVTLSTKPGDELRGCIGSIQPTAPLFQAVSSNAIAAAFRDPRFYPLMKDELPRLALEISVMGPIERVASVDEIETGRDGLIISRGHHSGLLLPQVATEYGWSRDEFLSHTCRKAGLPADAWRSPETKIEKFSAEVFGEE
jgi:AmmeMemoRadiSam system protein A